MYYSPIRRNMKLYPQFIGEEIKRCVSFIQVITGLGMTQIGTDRKMKSLLPTPYFIVKSVF
tara:strand:+ start:18157 stop:18339 length:183 start_codon:yes stop_codon:yes gene_type:complete